MANAKDIIYTGLALNHLVVPTNSKLDAILGLIDTAVGSGSGSSPDYSGYNLRCVTETDGVTHPTNTQNFAEGISKVLCDFKTAYTTFTGTTYVADQNAFTSAINGLQVPALTYSAFSITNTDTVTQVWNKSFTGFTGIINSIKPDSANWSSIGAGSTTSIVSAFNTLIAYEVTQDGNITGKQASLGTFNLTAIGGSTGQTPATAISSLVTYAGALPTYTSGSVTWGCVTPGGALQSDINNIVAKISSITTNYIADGTTGFTKTSIGSCLGYRLAIDPSWVGLYKVATNSTDAGNGTGDYLVNKITSLDGSITFDNSTHIDKLDMKVTVPVGKVKINSTDTTADYLQNKFTSSQDQAWGFALNVTTTAPSGNIGIKLTPTIGQTKLFGQSWLNLFSTDPDLLAGFQNLILQAQDVIGLPITDLSVSLSGGYVLGWTAKQGLSQSAKWRERGQSMWNTSFFTPSNPLSATAITTTNSGNVLNNIPRQFQVDTVYATGIAFSNVYESITFSCQTLTTTVVGGVISVSLPINYGVDIIEYQLYNSGPTLIQTGTASGANPSLSFTSVASGTYSILWRLGTTINGTVLYSDDASQIGDKCSHSGIVVP